MKKVKIRELVEKQKQKQFEKSLKEKVNLEDWKKWANQKDYIDILDEKIKSQNINEEVNKKIQQVSSLYPALFITPKGDSVIIENKQFNTKTEMFNSIFLLYTPAEIEKKTHHGKNVEFITRVTGYFSKVKNWNKGKQEEFKNRFRNKGGFDE